MVMRLPRAYGRRFGETSQILAHRYAIFLCSWDVEIDDSLVGQLTTQIQAEIQIRLKIQIQIMVMRLPMAYDRWFGETPLV